MLVVSVAAQSGRWCHCCWFSERKDWGMWRTREERKEERLVRLAWNSLCHLFLNASCAVNQLNKQPKTFSASYQTDTQHLVYLDFLSNRLKNAAKMLFNLNHGRWWGGERVIQEEVVMVNRWLACVITPFCLKLVLALHKKPRACSQKQRSKSKA